MKEKETRQKIIDKALEKAGWNVDDHTSVTTEFGIRKECADVKTPAMSYGSEYSDYVLKAKDGTPLAVVEAKKTSKEAELGREQAKQYCYNIQKQHGGDLPFCFYTNGLEIFFWDLENYPPRKIVGFPNRDDLERMRYIRNNRNPLTQELINTDIVGRDYHIKAIRAIMEDIESKRRAFLLVMATGTGKTRNAIALVDVLMRAGYVERTLFLVDRIALREQALDNFREHLPDEPRWPKRGEKIIETDRRIYVSTYPSMKNIISDERYAISPHFFDLVIVDESHRSIYNAYGEILRYFNTLTLGLTATPKDVIDHNTFKLFNCDNGLPTFAYTYEEAVNHRPPFLSDFEVMKIHTKFQDEGINKRTISLEDQKRLILQGKEIEEINYEGSELEKSVTNKGTNALIVKEFMEECIKDPDGVLPGKTIFFCATIKHARRIEELFDSLYPEYKGELAKVLVSDDSRVYGTGGLLDQFKNSDMPRIAISVDMLDTGIDIREIVNLVFAKPVYSYTKFWQMIGRGTRLLEKKKIRSWCPKKKKFLILDCWDNFEYFKLKPKGKEPTPQIPLPVQLCGLRIEKIEKAQHLHHQDIAENEIEKLREEIATLPQNSVVISEARSHLHEVEKDRFWDALTDEKLMFLRMHIKPLFRTMSQVDFKAMRFEKYLLETSIALLTEEEQKFDTLKSNLMEQIGELPLSVNIVAREQELIEKTQKESFWKNIKDEDFDRLKDRLSPLMKYRDTGAGVKKAAAFDLEDVVKVKESVEFGPEHESISISKYKEMVEERILELTESNPLLQKIKQGELITEIEAKELARILEDENPHITEELLRTVYRNRKARFMQFIKHILGIEILKSFPETVEESFEQFIQEHTNMSVKQLEFLELLKDFMIEREKVTKRDLIQSPFTLIHPQGIKGLFNKSEIEEILKLTEGLAA